MEKHRVSAPVVAIKILSTGMALPENCVSSAALDARLGKKDAVAQAVSTLAHQLPDRVFHFTDGRPGTEQRQQHNFCRIAWVDYSRWLSGYDVVIHHGGAGIMWHCLQKNIPALVYPVDYDQFDHAARLEYSGKGIWLRGGMHQLANAKPLLMKLLMARRVHASHPQ